MSVSRAGFDFPAAGACNVAKMKTHAFEPWRLAVSGDPAPILSLIRAEFADMDGRIDPPSSMHRLTEAGVTRQAETGEVWVIGPAQASPNAAKPAARGKPRRFFRCRRILDFLNTSTEGTDPSVRFHTPMSPATDKCFW